MINSIYQSQIYGYIFYGAIAILIFIFPPLIVFKTTRIRLKAVLIAWGALIAFVMHAISVENSQPYSDGGGTAVFIALFELYIVACVILLFVRLYITPAILNLYRRLKHQGE